MEKNRLLSATGAELARARDTLEKERRFAALADADSARLDWLIDGLNRERLQMDDHDGSDWHSMFPDEFNEGRPLPKIDRAAIDDAISKETP